MRVSTVTVDDIIDGVTIRLDNDGFHPDTITVKKVRVISTVVYHCQL